jgi:transposase
MPDSFPLWRTVYRWFARLRDDDTWETIWRTSRMKPLAREGPDYCRSHCA